MLRGDLLAPLYPGRLDWEFDDRPGLVELRDRLIRERTIWQREHRSAEFLNPPGARLREAEALLRTYGDHLDPATAAFIECSTQADLHTREREGLRVQVTAAARKLLEIGDADDQSDDPRRAALQQAETIRDLILAIRAASSNKELWGARLSAANEALGDALRAANDLMGAAAAYGDAAAEKKQQSDSDPENADQLRAVLVIFKKHSEVVPAGAAEPILQHALDIARQLAKADPNDRSAQAEAATLAARLEEAQSRAQSPSTNR